MDVLVRSTNLEREHRRHRCNVKQYRYTYFLLIASGRTIPILTVDLLKPDSFSTFIPPSGSDVINSAASSLSFRHLCFPVPRQTLYR